MNHTEDICLGCTLFSCRETAKGCRFTQITVRTPRERRERKAKAKAQLKEDILAILERLAGQKAVGRI